MNWPGDRQRCPSTSTLLTATVRGCTCCETAGIRSSAPFNVEGPRRPRILRWAGRSPWPRSQPGAVEAESCAVAVAWAKSRAFRRAPGAHRAHLSVRGIYLASASSSSSCLRAGQSAHGRAKPPQGRAPGHDATSPPSLPVWWLGHAYACPRVLGRWFPPLPDPDLIQPHDRRLGGSRQLRLPPCRASRASHGRLAEGICALEAKPVLHGDNGALSRHDGAGDALEWLGVNPSSRGRCEVMTKRLTRSFFASQISPGFPTQSLRRSRRAAPGGRLRAIGTTSTTPQRHSLRQPRSRHAGEDQRFPRPTCLYQRAANSILARSRRHPRLVAIGAVTLNPTRLQSSSALDSMPTSPWRRELRQTRERRTSGDRAERPRCSESALLLAKPATRPTVPSPLLRLLNTPNPWQRYYRFLSLRPQGLHLTTICDPSLRVR